MIRIVSANINGLNSAMKAGFFSLPHIASADVLCLQETQCDDAAHIGSALGYNVAASDGERPSTGGRRRHGGVAIFSRLQLADIADGGELLNQRGQFVTASVAGMRIASTYVTLDARPEQFVALDGAFQAMLDRSTLSLICGDMNTFRDSRDSWRFAEALKRRSEGCNERAMQWFSDMFARGWEDALETHCSLRPLHTWWWSEELFAETKGTRVDYVLVAPDLSPRIQSGSGAVFVQSRRGGHAQIAVSVAFEGPSSEHALHDRTTCAP